MNVPNNNDNTSADEVEFEYTGEGCVVPKNVTIARFHPSVIEVENWAFQYCNKLRGVVFNDGLQKIKGSAFSWCTSLEKITFPSTLKEVGQLSFDTCERLREVVFNDGLRKIGFRAFAGC